MVIDYILVVLATFFVILGLLGCILPVIPGPPFSWVGLLIVYYTPYGNFSGSLLLWTGVVALLVTVADYVLPIWTTRKMGGSKRGVVGATIGLVLGLFLFPPFGVIIGPFIGAFLGESTNKYSDKKSNPWLSATGSFLGFLLGTGLKFAISGVITYHFVVETYLR